jgi:DNA polymerase III epsilon subunit family exonuclease
MSHTPSPAQQRAIIAADGPVLVLAGPGAGKTFCLIQRVRHLIEQGAAPTRICAVTFTNKAAEEIALRLGNTMGAAARDVTRGTLHALCLGFLREFGDRVALPAGFGVADDAYQRLILRRLRVRPERHGALLMSFGRRRLQDGPLEPEGEALFERYREALADKRMIDFDDIIVRAGQLLSQCPDVAERVAGRWDHVLVDEFQDLDRTQFGIVSTLAAGHRSLFGVGDDEQSIFSWRGAEPEVLRQFASAFGVTEPIVLDENRRCSSQIFSAARRLIDRNPSLFDKALVATRRSDFEVEVREFPDDEAELAWLLDDVRADMAAHGGDWGDRAVLYRYHFMGEQLERCFLAAGIPCRLPRGRAMKDDEVISYVLASLRIIARPDDPLTVEQFAENVLPAALLQHIRARHMGDGDATFLSAIRGFAKRRPRADPEARMAWRFIYHVENLSALGQRHDSLPRLIEDLLAQRVGTYRNPLIEREDRLTDPADDPEVVDLARRLKPLSQGAGRLWITAANGLQFALRRLAAGAGLQCSIRYLTPETEPGGDDVVLDASSPGVSRRLFKALQLLACDDDGDAFDRFVCFDLETTDNDTDTCDIVEIGAVRVVAGQVVDTFHRLVKPEVPITVQATAVHGYGAVELKDAPSFAEVWPAFREFVGDDLLVAHNAWGFDVPVLERKVAEAGEAWAMTPFDTLPVARSLFSGSAKLTDLATRFGIDPGQAHHALDDAVTLAGVVEGLQRAKAARARRSSLANLLGYLGLALALEGAEHEGEEAVLLDAAFPATLGSYSDCLDRYAAERAGVLKGEALPVEEVIERLGGWDLMNRIRASRTARERYPQAMARLLGLVEATAGGALVERIQSLLECVALSTSEGADTDPNRVSLLTVHSTKGLEFSRVYIIGVEDYAFPGYRAFEDRIQHEIEEARRLLYVAMTRARDRLVLTRAEVRNTRPSGGRMFLDEIGIATVRVTEAQSSPSR